MRDGPLEGLILGSGGSTQQHFQSPDAQIMRAPWPETPKKFEVPVTLDPPWLCCRCGAAVVKIGHRYFEGPCGTHCPGCMKQHVKKCRVCTQKFPEAVTPRYGCPACKSEDVNENNVVQVRLRVTEWDAEGEPADYGHPWREVNDSIRCVTREEAPRYHCRDCDQEFETPEQIPQSPSVDG